MSSKVCILPVLLAMLLAVPGCGSRNPADRCDRGMEVRYVRAVEGSDTVVREYPFITRPFHTSRLSFRVSGPVGAFDIFPGQYFREGEVIAEIDRRDFMFRYEHAEAAFRHAQAEFRRMETLYSKDNISASAYEKVRSDYIAARTAFEKAEADLHDTSLSAPFSGYVEEVFAEPYQDVRASEPVLTLADISVHRIETFIPQDVVMKAGEIGTVDVTFDIFPGKIYKADVAECARSTSPGNLSYMMTALYRNSGTCFPAGISGRLYLRLPAEGSHTGVLVPQTAVCHDSRSGDYVWVADTHRSIVERRSVTLGEPGNGGLVHVTDGLSQGECVAVTGLRFLNEGSDVRLEDAGGSWRK